VPRADVGLKPSARARPKGNPSGLCRARDLIARLDNSILKPNSACSKEADDCPVFWFCFDHLDISTKEPYVSTKETCSGKTPGASIQASKASASPDLASNRIGPFRQPYRDAYSKSDRYVVPDQGRDCLAKPGRRFECTI